MKRTVETAYRIIRPGDGALERHVIAWPPEPGYLLIKNLVEPLLDGEPLEQVSVLHDGMPRDMFVSEVGRLAMPHRGPLPRNDRATAIYRTNWLTRHPGTDPETLHWIAGVAVLFERRVWL